MTLDEAIEFIDWIERNEGYGLQIRMPHEYLGKAEEAKKVIFNNILSGNPVPMYAYGYLYLVVSRIKGNIEYRNGERSKQNSRKTFNKAKAFMEIGNRDSFKCKNCGIDKGLEIDHIKPVCKGGGNELENLQLLCGSCNRRKSSKYIQGTGVQS